MSQIVAESLVSRERPPPAAIGADALTVTVHADLAAAEPVWRALEARGVLTPYQRFDWVRHYCDAGFEDHSTLRIVELAAHGTPFAILPLAIAPWMGAARGRVIGSDISNGDFIIMDRERAGLVTPAVLTEALDAVRAGGTALDMVLFANWPARWQGVDNPLLALPHALAPNTFYRVDLPEAKGGAFIEEAFPHKRRTNIRRSLRRLTEQFGELTLLRAKTPEEVERMHAVFLDQRARRFRQMGVENVFARPPFQRLFLAAAKAELGKAQPALSFHAVVAGGDTVLATSVGTYANGHYSQYINSTTDGPASKYSLMGVLMAMLVDELRASGVTSLDMGLGDFDYKVDWTEPEPVHDSIIAVTPRGRVMARALGAGRALKRGIKQNPAAWKLARGAMSLKAKISGR